MKAHVPSTLKLMTSPTLFDESTFSSTPTREEEETALYECPVPPRPFLLEHHPCGTLTRKVCLPTKTLPATAGWRLIEKFVANKKGKHCPN